MPKFSLLRSLHPGKKRGTERMQTTAMGEAAQATGNMSHKLRPSDRKTCALLTLAPRHGILATDLWMLAGMKQGTIPAGWFLLAKFPKTGRMPRGILCVMCGMNGPPYLSAQGT